jgi:hypothetical protein
MDHPLHHVRESFLRGYRSVVDEARDELADVVTELLMEIPGLAHAEACYRLYRIDIAGKRNGEITLREVRCDAQEVRNWQPLVPNGVQIDAPILWEGMEFDVVGARPSETALIEWATRWMDISDARYDESAEFQQVVHSISPPEPTSSGVHVSVDFGSAPTTAFDELLEVLLQGGATVSVGSFFLFDEDS